MDSTVFTTLGVLVFFISTIVFLIGNKNKLFHSAFFISAITCVSYLIMLQFPDMIFVRWIGYVFSCTTLVWVIGRYISLVPGRLLSVMFLTPLVMITGALASYSSGLWMLVWFVVGGLFYVLLLWFLLQGNKDLFSHVSQYIWFGWTAFPIVFLLSPEGFGLISLPVAVLLYLVLDVYTKIVFYKTVGIVKL